MGYGGHDDLMSELSSGKILTRDGTKQTSPAHTAGGWHLTAGMNGSPIATTFPGTDLVWSACDEKNGDGTSIFGIDHGGPVSPDTKHVISGGAMCVAAVGAPWLARLVDIQGYYRLSTTNVTGTGSRVLVNSNTFTASSSSGLLLTYANDWKPGTKVRFTTTGTLPTGLALNTDYWLIRVSATTARVAASYADYVAGTAIAYTDAGTGTHTLTMRPRNTAGLQAMFVVQTQPTAGGPNLTASSYTNSDGVAGRAFQGSPSMGATAEAYATRILHSGNAAGRYGPFMPLQGGDKGIQSIESFTWSTGTAYTGTGVVALALVRPIGRPFPLPVTGMYTERDFVNMIPSFPRIDDGACLSWLLFGAGATSNVSPLTFDLDFGWG